MEPSSDKKRRKKNKKHKKHRSKSSHRYSDSDDSSHSKPKHSEGKESGDSFDIHRGRKNKRHTNGGRSSKERHSVDSSADAEHHKHTQNRHPNPKSRQDTCEYVEKPLASSNSYVSPKENFKQRENLDYNFDFLRYKLSLGKIFFRDSSLSALAERFVGFCCKNT